MPSLTKLTTIFALLMQLQVVLSVEVVSHVLLEKVMEGIEEVLQNHSQKIERLETQMTEIVNKVALLEIKDQEILGKISKLEPQVRAAVKYVPRIYPSIISKGVTSMKNSLPAKEVTFQSTEATLKPEESKNDGVPSKESTIKTNNQIKQGSVARKNNLYFNDIVTHFSRENEQKEFQDFNVIKTTQPTLKSVVQMSTTTEFVKKIRLNHSDGRSYPLQNKNGKCLAVSTTGDKKVSENGAKIIQSNCNPLEKGQMWKWERKHLCNDWGKCLYVRNTTPGGKSNVVQWGLNTTEKNQKWIDLKKMGLLVNMDSCLSIVGNLHVNGAEAITEACNEKENSQVWSFVWNL